MTYEVKYKPRGKGRSKHQFKPEMIDETRILAGRGMTVEQIWNYFGLNKHAWYKLCDSNPELADAYFHGKARTIAIIAGKLVEIAKKGNLTAIIFYLKTQGAYSEYHNVAGLQKEEKFNALTPEGKPMDAVDAAKVYQQVMLAN